MLGIGLTLVSKDDRNWYLLNAYVAHHVKAWELVTNTDSAASILNRAGSIGLALIIWVIGFLMASAGFSVYLELASYFPNRSGSEVVYLEQAYPRPKHFFPITFAVQSVILSFSSSNAVGRWNTLNHWEIGSSLPSNSSVSVPLEND